MSMTIYKEAYFEASHRLLNYTGKCYRLHGHQWRVEVWITGEVDSETQILVDYNCIKQVVNQFDHQVILNRKDPMVESISAFQEVITTEGDPTSENLAGIIARLLDESCTAEGIPASVTKIRVWESTSCYAQLTFDAI
jgi:6-pyruvoyltetrahydropterin/6-carboxytetrahydropterin synthase